MQTLWYNRIINKDKGDIRMSAFKVIIILTAFAIFYKLYKQYKYVTTKKKVQAEYQEKLERETKSTHATQRNTLTNRKQAMFDYTNYNFDIPQALLKEDKSIESIKTKLTEVVLGQSNSDNLLQVFYSHEEFDKFSFIETANYTINREDVEKFVMLKSGKANKLLFPFAVKLNKYSFSVMSSDELATYFELNEFSSLNHTEISEIAWFFVWSDETLRNKLMKYRVCKKISQSVIDKFISLYVINEVTKQVVKNHDLNLQDVINDIEDNDLSTYIDEFRSLNSDITKKLQLALV